MKPFQVVKDFEAALCEYTGAPYAVTTTSCTMAILLACAWWKKKKGSKIVTLPKRTYIGVPMSVIHAGHKVSFVDGNWIGKYRLYPFPVFDSARHFTSGMYSSGWMYCLSFHWNKTLGIQQGGAILLEDTEADAWLRKARFDGRTEGVPPSLDTFDVLGYHAYMSPEVAAEGLVRLSHLPKHNEPLPNDDYPDLSKFEIFK